MEIISKEIKLQKLQQSLPALSSDSWHIKSRSHDQFIIVMSFKTAIKIWNLQYPSRF